MFGRDLEVQIIKKMNKTGYAILAYPVLYFVFYSCI